MCGRELLEDTIFVCFCIEKVKNSYISYDIVRIHDIV